MTAHDRDIIEYLETKTKRAQERARQIALDRAIADWQAKRRYSAEPKKEGVPWGWWLFLLIVIMSLASK